MSTVATILATGAALISAVAALVSWWYNREISQATVSLAEVKVTGSRIAPDRVKIDFLFVLKNAGKETLKILELRLGHYSFGNKVFEQVGEKPILNPIHGGTIFNYSTTLSTTIDPKTLNKAIGVIMPKVVGKHALILTLEYKGQSFFSRSVKQDKYYLGYKGLAGVYQLTEQEYDEMKGDLPSDFAKD